MSDKTMKREDIYALAMLALFGALMGTFLGALSNGIAWLLKIEAMNLYFVLYFSSAPVFLVIVVTIGKPCACEIMSRYGDHPREPLGLVGLVIPLCFIWGALLTLTPDVVHYVMLIVLGYVGLCSLISFLTVGKFAADKGKHSWAKMVMVLTYKGGGAVGTALGIFAFPEIRHHFKLYPRAVSIAAKFGSFVERLKAWEREEPAPRSAIVPTSDPQSAETPKNPTRIQVRAGIEINRNDTKDKEQP